MTPIIYNIQTKRCPYPFPLAGDNTMGSGNETSIIIQCHVYRIIIIIKFLLHEIVTKLIAKVLEAQI